MDDHDQRFKALLREFLPEFVALFLPDWADRFDFPRTQWLEQDAFLDPPGGDRKLLDLVAKVPTTVPVTDRPADCLLLIHVEVESGDSAADLRGRMLQYYAYLRRAHGLPVLPVGLFLRVGLGGSGRDVYEEAVWGRTLLRFEYVAVGLPALDGAAYHAGPNLLGVALSALMSLPVADRARRLAEGLERIAVSGENEARRFLLAECFENYFPLPDADRPEFERLAAERFPEGKVMLNSIEERGRIKERRALVTKLLERKFGALPAPVVEKLNGLSPERLEEIALELVGASSLAELGLTDE